MGDDGISGRIAIQSMACDQEDAMVIPQSERRGHPLFGGEGLVFAMLLAGFLLAGCPANKSKPTHLEDVSQPGWVLNPPVSRGFLYGVGAAEVFGGDDAGASSRAKDVARLELVKQIEVKVSGEVSQEIEEVTRNGATRLTERLRQSVQNRVPEFTLSYLSAVESYKDEKGKHVTVLLRLDVTKELQSLKRQIASLDGQLGDYAQKLSQTPPGGMSTLRLVSPALVLAEERAGLQARYNALDPEKNPTPLLTKTHQALIQKIYARIAGLNISVQAEGPGIRSLRSGLMAHLSKKGIRISKNDGGDIQIVYNLQVNTVSREGAYYAITEGDVRIKDVSGRVVRTLLAKAKGVSSDRLEDRSRSIAKLSEELGKALIEALF